MIKLTGRYEGQELEARGPGAAFFDVDGTLIQGDTQRMECRYLMTRTRPSPGRVLAFFRVLGALGLHKLGKISLARQNQAYLEIYRGLDRNSLTELGQRLFAWQVGARVFAQAEALIKAHRQQGDRIVLVSATTPHLIAPLADRVRPDQVFCTELAFDARGRATGRAIRGICIQEKKASLIQAFARTHRLDLSACHAYSDHHSDLPMLRAVGHPVAINPTPSLACHARDQGWPVLSFSLTP